MSKNYKSFFQIISFVFPYLYKIDTWKLRLSALFSLFFIFATIAINLLTPIFFKHLVNSLENFKELGVSESVFVLLCCYGGIWTLGQITSQLRELLMSKVFCRLLRKILSDISKHLIKLSMRFHTFKQTGSVLAALTQAADALPSIVFGTFFWIFPVCLEICLASAILTYSYGLMYGAIIFGLFICYLIYTMHGTKKILSLQKDLTQTRRNSFAKITDTLINIETVKYFGKEDFEIQSNFSMFKKREAAEGVFYEMVEFVHLVQGVIIGLGLMTTISLSGLKVINGQFSVGDFVMINSYILQFVGPFMVLSKIIRDIRKSIPNMQIAMSILDQKPEVVEIQNPVIANPDEELLIEFKNVRFGYFDDADIITNLSCKIEPNKMTAIVGSTGAGKSTITKLLYRFYDVTAGEILVNGKNIKNYSLQSLHDLFGIVPQIVAMFNDTFRYNLTYGKPDATEEEVWEAIKIAQLEQFVHSLPHGLESKVGEQGIRLSGGERQRLAIARAILRKPKLFVFDEATSALDAKTERCIQKSLNEISNNNVTTIVIAHRLSTISNADKIIVLNDGSVAEVGNHNELLEKNGIYAALWNSQFTPKEEIA